MKIQSLFFCANVEEANCNEFEASMKSRFHQRIKVETPAKDELIERVTAMTMCNDNSAFRQNGNRCPCSRSGYC